MTDNDLARTYYLQTGGSSEDKAAIYLLPPGQDPRLRGAPFYMVHYLDGYHLTVGAGVWESADQENEVRLRGAQIVIFTDVRTPDDGLGQHDSRMFEYNTIAPLDGRWHLKARPALTFAEINNWGAAYIPAEWAVESWEDAEERSALVVSEALRCGAMPSDMVDPEVIQEPADGDEEQDEDDGDVPYPAFEPTLSPEDQEIVYTDDEKDAMREALEDFEGMKVHPDHADRIHRSICSRALWHFAFDQLNGVVEDERLSPNRTDQEQRRRAALRKARPALEKAFAIYPLPLYLYDLAGVAELEGKPRRALDLYRRFLAEQRTFRADDIDRGLLLERDVAASVEDATRRASGIGKALGQTTEKPRKPWWKIW